VGKIEGDITGPMIHIAATGVVAGKVKVKELQSQGELAGEVEAETVQIAGTVRDKTVIRAKSLQVTLTTKKGMEVLFGECELAIGDEPNKEAAVAAALAPPIEAAKPETDTAKIDTKVDPAKPDEDRPKRNHSGTQPPPMS
jgi:cytoskeletal protein CcmA (bactofilin family)